MKFKNHTNIKFVLIELLLIVSTSYSLAQREVIIDKDYYKITALVYEDHVELSNLTGDIYRSSEEIVLPDSVENLPVTVIGGNGRFCNDMQSGHMTIPSTVREIKEGAFSKIFSCTFTIPLPSSLKKIGDNAFSDMYYLQMNSSAFLGVVLPDSLEEIGKNAFSYSGIHSVSIPKSVKSIGTGTFGCGRTELKSLKLLAPLKIIPSGFVKGATFLKLEIAYPDSITEIGSGAFDGCTYANVFLPPHIKKIGDCAFRGCSHLDNLKFSEELKELGESAFYGCERIKKVTFEKKSKINIPNSLFSGCAKLSYVVLPDTVYSIGGSAFENCDLENIQLPQTITRIGARAFAGNKSLKSIIIPENVTKIENAVFDGCSLEEVRMPSKVRSIGARAFCCGAKYIYLPDSLRTIGESAFSGFYREIIIPPYVSSIGKEALGTASYGEYPNWIGYLENIILEGTEYLDLKDVVRSSIYEGMYPRCLYVPFEIKDKYDQIDYTVVKGGIYGYDLKSVNEIADMGYYCVRNATTGKYLQLHTSESNEPTVVDESIKRQSAGTVLQFLGTGTPNKYYLTTQNMSTPLLCTVVLNQPSEYRDHPCYRKYNIMVGGKYLSVDDNGNVAYTDVPQNSEWYLTKSEQFEVKMIRGNDGKSYSSIFLPFDVKALDKTKIYTAREIKDGRMYLNPIEDNELRHGKGALVINEEGADAVTLQIVAGVKNKGNNILQGLYEDKYCSTAQEEYYVLDYNEEKGIGFYLSNSPILKANRVFVHGDYDGTDFIPFAIEDLDAGIPQNMYNLESHTAQDIYDLQGRQVVKPQKGVYIVRYSNGKLRKSVFK